MHQSLRGSREVLNLSTSVRREQRAHFDFSRAFEMVTELNAQALQSLREHRSLQ